MSTDFLLSLSLVRNRRRNGGRLLLRTIVPDVLIRERLVAGHFTSIVLYGDSDESYSLPLSDQSNSMIVSVAASLHQEAACANIFVLQGA
jgi:hypothetical protein